MSEHGDSVARPRVRAGRSTFLVVAALIATTLTGVAFVTLREPAGPVPVVLDTDIATDVDDALALGVLLGSPEIALVGVTTVYGDTLQRARFASRLIHLADPDLDIPVVVGQRQPLSKRPVWSSGHEGELFDDLALELISQSADDARFLIDTARRHRGKLVVLAVGPLTNIALALELDPGFADNVKDLVIMGGDFRTGDRTPEFNFYSDVVATQEIFDSNIHITVGGLDLTTQSKLGQSQRQLISRCGRLGAALADELDAWWAFQRHPWNYPHDPTLATWLVQPELFNTRHATVTIGDNGFSIDQHDQGGRVTIVDRMQNEPMIDAMTKRMCAAGRAHTP